MRPPLAPHRECEMDEALAQRYRAVEVAEREWREHRQAAWKFWSEQRPAEGTAPENPFTPEWRARDAELRARFNAEVEAWLAHLPHMYG